MCSLMASPKKSWELPAACRSVQPWVESIDWHLGCERPWSKARKAFSVLRIEDASYRAALKSLQKQFHRGQPFKLDLKQVDEACQELI